MENSSRSILRSLFLFVTLLVVIACVPPEGPVEQITYIADLDTAVSCKTNLDCVSCSGTVARNAQCEKGTCTQGSNVDCDEFGKTCSVSSGTASCGTSSQTESTTSKPSSGSSGVSASTKAEQAEPTTGSCTKEKIFECSYSQCKNDDSGKPTMVVYYGCKDGECVAGTPTACAPDAPCGKALIWGGQREVGLCGYGTK